MHIYELDGEKYPSVTTILKIISGNPELMKWANYMGFKRKDITKVLEESASFGTLVHSNLQAIVDPNAPTPIKPKDALEEYSLNKITGHFNKYFKDIHYTTIFSEKTIISPELGYAGTLDWLVKIKDMTVLLDFKTSKMPRPSMYLQLGGYYNLLKTLDIDADIAAIIIINEKGCALHPISKDAIIYNGRLFNLLFNFYKEWSGEIEPDYKLIPYFFG